ncbi:MFS transporter [Umezawaea tangerina]|uniref:Putative MFS family arabinose efflux permease n=1 Tax=Umezawaea tangerina TaxID=84725 RepID=A0A2T0SLP4_9PSEU|nr:MFS transporter [Umezawaea tangerina]PRY34337.1 putative MFS family arabinose efflux permease [Umezawaea tangerina]
MRSALPVRRCAVRRALLDVAPLRESVAFRRLWVGRVFSGFGSQMTLVAVMFQVWSATGSTVWTGAVGLAQAVPVIAFGLFAGSLVDRVDRRRFYLVTLVGQASCSALLAVQGFLGGTPVVLVLALVAVQSCFVAGGGPASRTFIPRLLPKGQLAAGLALNRIAFQGAMLLGPALGGVVVGWLGVGGCYLVDAVTFGVAFYGAFGLPAMVPEGELSRPGLRGVGDGLAFLVRNPVVRGALLTDLAATVLSMPISLFPLVNEERFGGDPRTFGLFLTAIAVGGVVASVFSGVFTRSPRPGVVMLVASAGWGVTLALFGMSVNPWLGLGFLVLAGVADTVSVVSRGALVQSHTPDALLGRVSAAEQIVGQAGPDVGNLRGGLVASATSGVTSLVGGGVLCVVAVVLVGATTPGLRRAA